MCPVGSTVSSFRSESSEIVQGSVLGPALFNLFINDITDNLGDNIKVKLFADNVKLYFRDVYLCISVHFPRTS